MNESKTPRSYEDRARECRELAKTHPQHQEGYLAEARHWEDKADEREGLNEYQRAELQADIEKTHHSVIRKAQKLATELRRKGRTALEDQEDAGRRLATWAHTQHGGSWKGIAEMLFEAAEVTSTGRRNRLPTLFRRIMSHAEVRAYAIDEASE